MSGLRYPGGKTRAVKLLAKFIPSHCTTFISPFVGGGSFEFYLATKGHVWAFDIFKPLVCYWTWLLHDRNMLADAVADLFPINETVFKNLRNLLRDENFTYTVENAAAYFALNRSSFSGTTLSGGYSNEAATKRFTQSSIDRIRAIALEYPAINNIEVNCLDFETSLTLHPEALAFCDPPYVGAKKLYGNNGEGQNINHEALRELLRLRERWIVTYDDHPLVRKLYEGEAIIELNWAYGMNASKKSNEIVILSETVLFDLWEEGILEFGGTKIIV